MKGNCRDAETQRRNGCAGIRAAYDEAGRPVDVAERAFATAWAASRGAVPLWRARPTFYLADRNAQEFLFSRRVFLKAGTGELFLRISFKKRALSIPFRICFCFASAPDIDMKYSKIIGFYSNRKLFYKKIDLMFLSVGLRGYMQLALALFACFWVTMASASALPPAQLIYSIHPKKPPFPVSLLFLSQPRDTPEGLCREVIAEHSLQIWKLVGVPSKVNSSSVSGSLPALFCSYEYQVELGTNYVLHYPAANLPFTAYRGCPANATAALDGDTCRCDAGFQEDLTGQSCEAVPPEPEKCSVEGEQQGNPILPATGEKYRFEEDLTDGGTAALSFSRIYRSTWASNANLPSTGMGKGWTHNHDMSLRATPKSAPIAVSVATPEGYTRGFTYDKESTARWKPTNSADTLFATIEGGWAYTRADDDTRFVFDAAGRLLSRTARNGWTTAYARDASGRITTITNPFGRSLRLSYDDQGRIASVSAPDARTLNYSYDAAGRLTAVRYPDSRTRGFLYENAAFPNALTGLMDENNARFATFTYDAQGRAVSTELAGSAERYEVSYFDAVPGMAFVTDPLGTFRSFGYVYDEQGTLKGEYGAGGAKSTGSRQYVWLPTPAGPMPVATIKDGTTVQNATADHLNTPRRVAGAEGTLLWQWPYSAFGEDQPTVAERRFATTGAVDGDMEFNLRYPGQYFDKESKLHYNGFRTYDPATGRYTQADPIGLNGGANRFGYVDANPLNFIDSEGLQVRGIRNPISMLEGGAGGGGAVGGGGSSAPNFAVSPKGTAFPIPSGARKPVPVTNPGGNTTGAAFTGGKGGANGQVCTVRFMDPTPPKGASPGYPNGYVKYENASGQGVDPYTGRTLPNSESHYSK